MLVSVRQMSDYVSTEAYVSYIRKAYSEYETALIPVYAPTLPGRRTTGCLSIRRLTTTHFSSILRVENN